LWPPTLSGSLGDLFGECAVERSAGFSKFRVTYIAVAVLHHPPGALSQNVVQFASVYLNPTFGAGTAGHITENLIDQPVQPRAHVGFAQIGPHQPHATIDIKAYAARRHQAVVYIHRGHSADREPVALVNIGHRQTRPHDTWQGGDIHRLNQRLIFSNLFNQ
jgi:hypothetical protein